MNPGFLADTIKVRLQTQSSTKPIYSGVIDCFKKTLQWEGIGGLYKGMSSPMVGQMAFRASFFTAFAESKKLFAYNPDGSSRELNGWDLFRVCLFLMLVEIRVLFAFQHGRSIP